jgi:diaminohydroxyphosphoribosylaminopyrimidine deaminase/5-amino-6-(5-phosphoribosylamino)uracil reductase
VDDLGWLSLAVDLAALCPPSQTAFSVGAVIVGPGGTEIARGYSRETDPRDHAEEAALRKITEIPEDATIYSSLEPCSKRASRPKTCTQLILEAAIGRVVLAWREPPLFVDCDGVALLREAGVTVVELPELAEAARRPNAHLLG